MHLFIHSVIGSFLKIKLKVFSKMDCFTCSHFVNFLLKLQARVGFRSTLQISVEGKALFFQQLTFGRQCCFLCIIEILKAVETRAVAFWRFLKQRYLLIQRMDSSQSIISHISKMCQSGRNTPFCIIFLLNVFSTLYVILLGRGEVNQLCLAQTWTAFLNNCNRADLYILEWFLFNYSVE